MNERNLSRKLSTSVVDALKAHGHILVVKGGATALARELEELMAPSLGPIATRLEPHPIVGSEVTSTFGDESIDDTVEEMVARMTRALMDSDHVEDVFAEDNVIRRDIFRAVRDGLLQRAIVLGADDDDEETAVKVRLDMLGYVAATVSKRADASTLRNALERAATMAQASFAAYSADAREATFRLEGDGPDERLELEEAVADELTDLVEQGLVDLPTVERRVDVARALSPADQRGVRRRVEAVAEATLRSGGCAASWDFVDASTLRVTFTPLSDKDGREVDKLLASFVRELPSALAEVKVTAGPRSTRTPALAADRDVASGSRPRAGAGPTSSRGKAAARGLEPVIVEPEGAFDDDEDLEVIQVVPPSKRARAASSGGKAAPASARDGAAAATKPRARKAAPSDEAAPSAKAPSSAKAGAASAAAARATTRTAAPSRTSKRAAPKRAAAAEPAPAKPRATAAKAARKPSATVKAPAARRAAAPAAKVRKAPAKKR